MATICRKRYFHIDENASSEQIYVLLDDIESADEDDHGLLYLHGQLYCIFALKIVG